MSGRPRRGDDGVGRLLVVSLHQAIGEVLPQRLEYYEHWLGPMGFKDGRSGLAPLGAVLSFLRQEGREVYDGVMTRAGHASADWYLAERAASARVARALPTGWCRRLALARSRRLVRAAFDPARARVRVRRGRGRIDVEGSIFCALREPWPWPTCTYFSAAVERHLALSGADAAVVIAQCRATGAGSCHLDVTFGGTAAAPAADAGAR
ncbi:MAG: hypothetical protein AB7U83_18995 [Vicinamibacterales bacterium]